MWRTAWFTTWILWLGIIGCDYPRAQFKPYFYPIQSSIPELKQSVSVLESIAEMPTSTVTADDDLWSRLQRADTHYIVLMRHAIAPGTGDPANFQLADCSTQRNLSDEGRAQARLTGDSFKQQGILVNRVLSSQWCRCLETAELMDIGHVEPFPALNSFFRNRATGPEQTTQIREFMVESQGTSGVTVMVTHAVNVSALTGVGVSSGEMVVMAVNDDNQIELVGQIDAL